MNADDKRQHYSDSWLNALSGMVRQGADTGHASPVDSLDDRCTRISLVAKIRWIMLAAVAIYGVFAAVCYSFSPVGFMFGGQQVAFLVLTALAVMAYNVALASMCTVLRRLPFLVHVQILLDLFFVTVLIHFTGGVVSWFWPVYLLVTLESAFLFDKKKDVWLIGAVGAMLYGLLLLLEQQHLVTLVSMPFVSDKLHEESLFQVLMWCWVAGMNAAVALIGAFLMDIIRRDHRRVRDSQTALLGFIGSASDLMFCCNPDGSLVFANQAFCDALMLDAGSLHEKSLFGFAAEEDREALGASFSSVLKDQQSVYLETTLYADGDTRIDVEMSFSYSMNDGEGPVVWGVCRDISERKRTQQELYMLAHHDVLTGLPNRILLQDRLVQARALANRLNGSFALLFLDLDRFKIINDTLGHSVGDELLRLVATRLKRTLREIDTVARIGGDEFVVLLNIAERDEVTSLADKVLKSLSLPFHLRNHELFVTTSIGISVYPDNSSDGEDLMKKADIAMYHAKALGRNNFQLFNEEMDQNASRRFVISNSLRRGLNRNEFRVYYQPKLDVMSGSIVAMEALVRWEHPELGLLSPIEFIQLAEESGLIMQLGEWVLREVCRQIVEWCNQGIGEVRVAVNLSGYQLQHDSLLSAVKRIIGETGVSPRCLEFEITESVVMQNPDYAISILNEISDMGIHISIDDFGTGYSSLSHLKRFSVNTLKIDKSFIKDVDLNETDAAIATAIIAMGNSLKLNVIAEGVETQAQFDFLKENRCDQVQGFLFSKPLPSAEIIKLLKSNILRTPGAEGNKDE